METIKEVPREWSELCESVKRTTCPVCGEPGVQPTGGGGCRSYFCRECKNHCENPCPSPEQIAALCEAAVPQKFKEEVERRAKHDCRRDIRTDHVAIRALVSSMLDRFGDGARIKHSNVRPW